MQPMRSTATTEGRDRFGLRGQLEEFANAQWLPAHCTPEEATAIVLAQFRLAVQQEFKLLMVIPDTVGTILGS